jgi:hypothetical protein
MSPVPDPIDDVVARAQQPASMVSEIDGFDIHSAVARAAHAMWQQYSVRRIPQKHLETIAQAVLYGHHTDAHVQRRVDEAVAEERARAEKQQAAVLLSAEQRHANDLVELNDEILRVSQREFNAGKRFVREKHKELGSTLDVLRDVRAFIASAVSWNGKAGERDETLRKIDEALVNYPDLEQGPKA